MPVVYTMGTGLPFGSGSADLTLDAVKQLGYEQIPIWDGPTYLYTTNRVHFRGTYNPANGFAWNFGHEEPLGGNFTGDYPILVPGSPAPDTNVAIRHFLMQPRGTLTYNIGGVAQPIPPGSNVVIVGGRNDIIVPTTIQGADDNDNTVPYTIDCKNGPMPLHCNVVEIKGTKTYLVDWAIEFYVNESYIFRKSTTLSALLSQRWEMQEDLDQDFFATRTITGHAIFRSDRLQVLNAIADDFRAWLITPALNNFQRTLQKVLISEDGTRLDYVLVDREKPFNLTPTVLGRNVTKIEAEYTQEYIKKMGNEEFARRGVFVGAEAIALTALGRTSAIDPGVGARAAIRKLADFLMGPGFDTIPRLHKQISVSVWGNRNSNRADLYRTALDVVAAKFDSSPFLLASGSGSVTENLMGKYVHVEVKVLAGPIQTTLSNQKINFGVPSIGTNDLIPGVTQSDPFAPQAIPPLDQGTRSNFYAAVTQVLTGADETSPRANATFNRTYNSLDPTGAEF